MADDPFEATLVHLHVQRRKADSAEARCPAHDDKVASLSVARGKDVPVVLHCHAGCQPEAVAAALGFSLAELTGSTPHRVTAYPYARIGPNGEPELAYWVERWHPKTFRPRLADGRYERPAPADEVLFNLPNVLTAKAEGQPIYLVEGERDVETAGDFGLVATTAMSGATQPWLPQFTEALAGAHLIIVADDDPPGRTRARHLRQELGPFCRDARAVLPRFGKDLSDHLWAGYGPDLLLPLPTNDGAVVSFDYANIVTEPMTWAWDGWVPRGMFTLIEGDPGDGKSVLSMDLAARWTAGMAMPDGTANPFGRPVNVGLMSAEDDPARVIRPRLVVAGGDPRRLTGLAGIAVGARYPRTLDLGIDIELLRDSIDANSLEVLVVDPLMAYLGSTRTAVDSEVRNVLTPLRYVAEETGCTIVAVRHLRKAGGKAVHAGGGSIAFTGAARTVLLVGRDPRSDPDEQLRVLAPTKSNVAVMPQALAYAVVSDSIGFDSSTARVRWRGSSDLTAQDLLDSDLVIERADVRGEVAGELVNLLTVSDLDFATMKRKVYAAGVECSDKLLRDVLNSVAVHVRENTGTGAYRSIWRLKSHTQGPAEPPAAEQARAAVVALLQLEPQTFAAIAAHVESLGIVVSEKALRRLLASDSTAVTTGVGTPDRTVTYHSKMAAEPQDGSTSPGDPLGHDGESSAILGPPAILGDPPKAPDEFAVACSVCTATSDILYWDEVGAWRCRLHSPLTFRGDAEAEQ